MDILGVGAPELLFIIIIALIVLGPRDMQKAGKTIGRWLNNLVRSDSWKAFQQTSRELRSLPTKLMREANLEMMEAEKELRKAMETEMKETEKELRNSIDEKLKSSASSASSNLSQPQETENTIQPPAAKPPENEADSDSHEKNS